MKKGTILKTILLAFMAMSATNASGQTTWVYSYDNAGNRTQRVVNSGSKARQTTATKPNNLLRDEKISATIDDSRNSIKVEILGLTNFDVADANIYDLSGIQLLSQHIESVVTTLNLAKMRKGTYILNIVLNGESRSCKFNK